jgi:hypothetical protein
MTMKQAYCGVTRSPCRKFIVCKLSRKEYENGVHTEATPIRGYVVICFLCVQQ